MDLTHTGMVSIAAWMNLVDRFDEPSNMDYITWCAFFLFGAFFDLTLLQEHWSISRVNGTMGIRRPPNRSHN